MHSTSHSENHSQCVNHEEIRKSASSGAIRLGLQPKSYHKLKGRSFHIDECTMAKTRCWAMAVFTWGTTVTDQVYPPHGVDGKDSGVLRIKSQRYLEASPG